MTTRLSTSNIARCILQEAGVGTFKRESSYIVSKRLRYGKDKQATEIV
jgi:hypothetical protein